MEQRDFKGFQEVMEGVYNFYGRASSPFALDVWWTALKAFDLVAIREALGRHCVNPDTGQFMPKPADVVRMLEGSTTDSAMAAWAKVDRAIGAVGTYRSVAFDDALIHRVISDMGGWTGLGRKTIDEWPFVAKEFQTRYRGFKLRRDTPTYPPKLVGIFDQQNAANGLESLEGVVLIGAQEEARRVFAGGSDQALIKIGTMMPQLEHRESA